MKEEMLEGESLRKVEAETVTRWDETKNAAIIFTASTKTKNELLRKGYKLVNGKGAEWQFECDKKFITFRTIEKVENPKQVKTKSLSKSQISKMQDGRKSKNNKNIKQN